MAMEVGDILEVVWEQEYAGQVIQNVQMVRVEEHTPDTRYQDIAETAFGKWVVNVLDVQSNQLTLLGVAIKNLTNGVDIGGHTGANPTGGQTSNGLPPFVTFSFQQTRATALTRHGHKLICGVTEEQQALGSTSFSSGQIDQMKNIFMDEWVLDVGGSPDRDFVVKPVIVGRTLNSATPPYYEVDLTKINEIQDVRFRSISSANSRKINRGI